MRTARTSRHGGYTMVELLVVAGIMALISAGCMSMLIASMRSFESTTVKSYSDSDAVMAMQKIVSDIREAKSFSIISYGERLLLVFPKTQPSGYYDRREPDVSNQVYYYLSDASGYSGTTGNILWRAASDGTRRKVASNVSDLSFETDTTRSVKITVTSSHDTSHGEKTTRLTERVVYLRNY